MGFSIAERVPFTSTVTTTTMWTLKLYYIPYGIAHFRHCRTLIWKKLYGAIRRKAITIYGEWESANTTLVMRESNSIHKCAMYTEIESNGMEWNGME